MPLSAKSGRRIDRTLSDTGGRMQRTPRAIFISLAMVCSPVSASYLDEPPNINSVGTIGDEKEFLAKIEPRVESDYWRSNTFNLIVTTSTGNRITFPFDAAYGIFRLYIIKLDGGSSPDYVLITAQGEGSDATSYYMDIYRIEHDKLIKSYEKQVSDRFGVSAMWRYDMCFTDIKPDVSALDLHLHLEIYHPSDLDDRSLIPASKSLRIVWDDKADKFIEMPGVADSGC